MLQPKIEFSDVEQEWSILVGYKNMGKRYAIDFSAHLMMWEDTLMLRPTIKGVESANDVAPDVQMFLNASFEIALSEINPFFIVPIFTYRSLANEPMIEQLFYYKWSGIKNGRSNFTITEASRQERDLIHQRLAEECQKRGLLAEWKSLRPAYPDTNNMHR